MADPDLQIREGPGHPDHEIRRGRGSPKTFVWPFGPRFSLTIRGGRGGGIRHSFHNICITFKTGSTKGTNGN